MDFAVLMGFVACAVVLALAIDLSGSTVQTVGGMYHAPDLGWPSGVQEDDDLHWSWTAGMPGDRVGDRSGDRVGDRSGDRVGDRPGARRIAEPELEEVDPRSIRVQLQPIRRGSH